VLLRTDWIRIGLRHTLNYVHVSDVKFVAAWRTLVGTNLAFDDHARFLRQRLIASNTSGVTAFFGTTP